MSGEAADRRPICGQCDRPVDSVLVEREGDDMLVYFICHGCVDVLKIDRYVLMVAHRGALSFAFERAFVSGPGRPEP